LQRKIFVTIAGWGFHCELLDENTDFDVKIDDMKWKNKKS